MNEIKIFKNEQFGEIRTIQKEGEVWFVAKDIAERLGYKNTSDAIFSHVDEDDKKKIAFSDYPQFGNKGAVLINESGLYSLILSSKLPDAKKEEGLNVLNGQFCTFRRYNLYQPKMKQTKSKIRALF